MTKLRVAFLNFAKATRNSTKNLMEIIAVLELFHTDLCVTATG